MIDLVKYKQVPCEIEDTVLYTLPVKESIDFVNCINVSIDEIVKQMKIHKSNLDKIKNIMKG